MKLLLRLIGGLFILGLITAAVGSWMTFASNTPDFEGHRSVKIPPGSSFDQVADSLATNGLLNSRQTFEWIATASTWRRQMKPGHYRFEAGASNFDMLDKIRKGRQDPIRVTVPPGVRPSSISIWG